jgi:hypothetical protein
MKSIITISLILLSLIARSQSILPEEIEARMQNLQIRNSPEFVTLITNETTFISGQTIYYKIFLSGTSPQTLQDLSVVGYVELRRNSEVLTRQKIKLSEGTGYGDIDLPTHLQTDEYQLVAFTAWSQNLGDMGYAKADLTIIHPESASLPEATQQKQSFFHYRFTKDSLSIILNHPLQQATLVGVQYNKVVLWGLSKNNQTQYRIPRSSLNTGFLFLSVISENNVVKESGHISVIPANLELDTDRTNLFSRNKLEITCRECPTATSSLVAVKRENLIAATFHSSFNPIQYALNPQSVKVMNEKERVIYPLTQSTLNPVPFEQRTPQPIRMGELKGAAFEQYQIQNAVQSAYNTQEQSSILTRHRIPYDLIFYPKDFSPLPTFHEFLKEITSSVKVKTKKGEHILLLKNNENPQNVFYYKSPPLIVIDGFVTQDINSLLSIDPAQIDYFTITFKLNTINRSAIMRLSDCGILSVYTKNRNNQVKKDFEIYQGFHSPSLITFPTHKKSSDDELVPDFRRTIYWSPDFTLNQKSKPSFFLSDDLGKLTISISGVTNDGQFFQVEKGVTVNFEAN